MVHTVSIVKLTTLARVDWGADPAAVHRRGEHRGPVRRVMTTRARSSGDCTGCSSAVEVVLPSTGASSMPAATHAPGDLERALRGSRAEQRR